MTVAPKPPVTNRKRQKPTQAKDPSVKTLGSLRSSPAWLIGLRHLQSRCAATTGLLVTTLLLAYGWSAYSQHSWQQAHSKLENLKKQERQLMRTNEVLKNELASQAQQPAVGLVPPIASEAIALKLSSQPTKISHIPPIAQAKHLSSLPVGY